MSEESNEPFYIEEDGSGGVLSVGVEDSMGRRLALGNRWDLERLLDDLDSRAYSYAAKNLNAFDDNCEG